MSIIPLTAEDQMIARRVMGVLTQFAYGRADRNDASIMRVAERMPFAATPDFHFSRASQGMTDEEYIDTFVT